LENKASVYQVGHRLRWTSKVNEESDMQKVTSESTGFKFLSPSCPSASNEVNWKDVEFHIGVTQRSLLYCSCH